jgi:hypothetical protein
MAASGESCRDNGHGFSFLDEPGRVKKKSDLVVIASGG